MMPLVSAKPCGCDPSARWECDEHRGERDLSAILAALEKEIQLYLRTGMRVTPGRLSLWLHDVRIAQTSKPHTRVDGEAS